MVHYKIDRDFSLTLTFQNPTMDPERQILTSLGFGGRVGESSDEIPPKLRLALDRYFSGEDENFSHIKLAPSGTDFQQKVWRELRKIPRGATISYKELAAQLGMPKANRAVGAANGKNPIPLLIPCHRVVGSKGKLVGFSAGLEWKKRLLELEGVRLREHALA